MRKIISICICLIVAFAVTGEAGVYSQTRAFNNESIATENTLTTSVYAIGSSTGFACWLDVDVPTGQSGTSNLNIWAEYSYDTTAAHFAKINPGIDLVTDFTSVDPIVIPFPATYPTAKYMRIKIEGVKGSISAGNTTGTTVTMYFMKQDN